MDLEKGDKILILQVGFGEIEAMIRMVDRNKDGKISYSEFRVGNTGTIYFGKKISVNICLLVIKNSF